MSTRCCINFCEGKTIFAKVYRHSDGYPEGVKPDLQEFFETVEKQTKDTRFDDPTYLAAKYVVWQAIQYAGGYKMIGNEFTKVPASMDNYLDFLSVGVMLENPGDIEYEYFVNCGAKDKNGRPTVKVTKPTMSFDEMVPPMTKKELAAYNKGKQDASFDAAVDV